MRSSTIGLVVLALGAVACEPPPEPFSSDVFWVKFTEVGAPCAPLEVIDTFTNAEPPATSNATVETSESIPGRYIAVTLGEEGTAFVNNDGDVLVGQVNPNGSIEATFINEDLSNETRSAETYTAVRIEEEIVEQTMTLVPNNNEENPRFTGTFTRRDYFLLDLTETDEWDPEIVGTGATQIPETDDWLEWTVQTQGSTINQEFRDDCPEDDCNVRVIEDCTREFDLEAVRIEGNDLGDFDVLVGFDQPTGVQ